MNPDALIQVVYEDPRFGRRLKALLTGRGHRLVLSSSTGEARPSPDGDAPDLVICELGATRSAVYELCRGLRKDERVCEPRVLLVSSGVDAQGVLNGLEAGADDVLAGSYDDEALAERVEALLAAGGPWQDHAAVSGRAGAWRSHREVRCQAEKMDVAGRLAGGVAHDVNNILMVIKGFTDILDQSFDVDDKRRQFAAEIVKAADQAVKLSRQLMLVAGRDSGNLGPVDLAKLLAELRPQLAQSVGSGVDLHIDCDPDVGMISAEPNLLTTLVSNLCINAGEAMPSGGELRIVVRSLDAQAGEPAGQEGAGAAVVLEVRDTGPGIGAGNLSHIFEPFYTTKPAKKGLGLAIVYGIAQQLGGRIECSSTSGSGTTFSLYLKKLDSEETFHARK